MKSTSKALKMSESKKPPNARYGSLNIGEIINMAAERRNFRTKSNRSHPCRSQHTSPDTASKARNSDLASPERPTISTLRKRKIIKSPDISPRLAVEVVQDYIIPLFKADKQNKQELYLVNTYGNRSPTSPTTQTTYPSPTDIKKELLLSSQIFKDYKELEAKVTELESALKAAIQDKTLIEIELNQIKKKFIDLQTEHQLLLFNFLKGQGHSNYLEQSSGLIRMNDEKLLKSVKRLEKENRELQTMVTEEKQVNDIRLIFMFALTEYINSAIN